MGNLVLSCLFGGSCGKFGFVLHGLFGGTCGKFGFGLFGLFGGTGGGGQFCFGFIGLFGGTCKKKRSGEGNWLISLVASWSFDVLLIEGIGSIFMVCNGDICVD